MKESTIIRTVLDRVKTLRRLGHPVKAVKLHGSRYVEAGTPDLHITAAGRSIWLEAKRPGKKPTPLQRLRLREWGAAGAVTGVVESVDEAMEIIMGVLREAADAAGGMKDGQ